MYNKTNVNSKCSMRVIKGCTGQPLGLSLPRIWPLHLPTPLTGHPARTETEDVTTLPEDQSWHGRRRPSPESEAHGGGDGRGSARACPGPRGSCQGAQQGVSLLWEAVYGMVTAT